MLHILRLTQWSTAPTTLSSWEDRLSWQRSGDPTGEIVDDYEDDTEEINVDICRETKEQDRLHSGLTEKCRITATCIKEQWHRLVTAHYLPPSHPHQHLLHHPIIFPTPPQAMSNNQMPNDENNILMENLLKLLQVSNWKQNILWEDL